MKKFPLLWAVALVIYALPGYTQSTTTSPVNNASSTLCITHANLIDVSSSKTLADQTIIIEHDRILATGPSKKLKVPAGATIIDATGKYVMPGMTDAHIHFFQTGGLYTRPDGLNLQAVYPYEKDQLWAKEHLSDLMARYLACGITTVVDVGGPFSNFTIRDKVNADPRATNAWVTGPLISTYLPPNLDKKDPPIVKVTTPEEARELVKKQLPYKPDFIKIWYIVLPGMPAESTLQIVKATIEESHAHGLKVAVHATEYETAKLAVTAGADILVHSVDDKELDDDMLQLLKNKHTVYIPTLTVMHGYKRAFTQQFDFPMHDLKYGDPFMLGTLTDLQHIDKSVAGFEYKTLRTRHIIPSKEDTVMHTNLRLAEQAGINVVAGTDAGNIGTLHASSFFTELQAMQQSGLSNREIIRSATINAAKGFGKDKDYGSIEKGKIADLLLLEKDPTQDLNALADIQTIIHRGVQLQAKELLTPTPAILVQQQLNGYNARNIDAFLAPYSDSTSIYDQASGKLLMQGKEQMRQRYAAMFEKAKELHCQLVNRIVMGNTVIDHERVTGVGEKPMEAVAVYTVENDKIVKVSFIH
ncbi:amidohydrolase family protein [Chitinophaga ginsengisoli]|uniref:Imidazolonepropionase-like amidohydrolase n=1 Tax=Chitinophaga ginsengisoli TaxID=363837 RepID=A0A2P8FQ03_9BACT|nr:amidohydrolase family protein [Chitinophaga ginsengisoli]PSL23777.1 imidazolonepropionase-like amidohydrolase [Chitinophaga ginsengisoli]